MVPKQFEPFEFDCRSMDSKATDQNAFARFFSITFRYGSLTVRLSLRKHAYSNILKISSPKTESFQIKNSDIFHISAQNVDCGYSLESPRRGGSNEYPQSMFLSRNKKNNVYPCKPKIYCLKVGFKGVKII